jgi:hypothetical protein
MLKKKILDYRPIGRKINIRSVPLFKRQTFEARNMSSIGIISQPEEEEFWNDVLK